MGALLRIADALEEMSPSGRREAKYLRNKFNEFNQSRVYYKQIMSWMETRSVPIPKRMSTHMIAKAFIEVNGHDCPDAFKTVVPWDRLMSCLPKQQGFGEKTTAQLQAWLTEVFPGAWEDGDD